MASKLISCDIPITSIAFNADNSRLAVALANNNVDIYKYENRKWTLVTTLAKHVSRVTGIDWAPNTNKIVTCGSDRNAYVWEMTSPDKWETIHQVLLRISRAATIVKWSPKEDKFAVGSAARQATICYFEESQRSWVSKHIKKPIKSTVVALSWHPNNYLIAIGSTDCTCRVYSTFIKEIEAKPTDQSWGKRMPFGNMMTEYSSSAWVSVVSFSPDGNALVFASHDSVISMAFSVDQGLEVEKYYSKFLPLTTLEWTSAAQFIGAGHDKKVYQFTSEGGKIICDGHHSGKGNNSNTTQSAKSIFENRSSKNTTDSAVIETCHKAPISDLVIADGVKGSVKSFATSSGDGSVYLWQWNKLGNSLE